MRFRNSFIGTHVRGENLTLRRRFGEHSELWSLLRLRTNETYLYFDVASVFSQPPHRLPSRRAGTHRYVAERVERPSLLTGLGTPDQPVRRFCQLDSELHSVRVATVCVAVALESL